METICAPGRFCLMRFGAPNILLRCIGRENKGFIPTFANCIFLLLLLNKIIFTSFSFENRLCERNYFAKRQWNNACRKWWSSARHIFYFHLCWDTFFCPFRRHRKQIEWIPYTHKYHIQFHRICSGAWTTTNRKERNIYLTGIALRKPSSNECHSFYLS